MEELLFLQHNFLFYPTNITAIDVIKDLLIKNFFEGRFIVFITNDFDKINEIYSNKLDKSFYLPYTNNKNINDNMLIVVDSLTDFYQHELHLLKWKSNKFLFLTDWLTEPTVYEKIKSIYNPGSVDFNNVGLTKSLSIKRDNILNITTNLYLINYPPNIISVESSIQEKSWGKIKSDKGVKEMMNNNLITTFENVNFNPNDLIDTEWLNDAYIEDLVNFSPKLNTIVNTVVNTIVNTVEKNNVKHIIYTRFNKKGGKEFIEKVLNYHKLTDIIVLYNNFNIEELKIKGIVYIHFLEGLDFNRFVYIYNNIIGKVEKLFLNFYVSNITDKNYYTHLAKKINQQIDFYNKITYSK